MPEDQILDPEIKAQLPQMDVEPQKPWYKQGKVIFSALIAVLIIFGISWYFIWGKTPTTALTSTKVSVNVKGPATVASGTEAEYKIMYHNDENADMTNVKLDMIYPSNFQFKSSSPASLSSRGQSFNLAVLKSGGDAEVTIRGKVSGSTGEDKQFLAKLHYSLSNFNSSFEVDSTAHTAILAPNLTLEITGDLKAPAGQDTTFNINYANVSTQDYDNMVITVVYPPGFKFTQASTKPSKNDNYWVIGKLAMNTVGHITITGSFTGQNYDEQLLTVNLGQIINNNFASQISSTATFQLTNPPITLLQSVEPSGPVKLGDNINFTIKYQNTSNVGLTNVVITDTINSNLLDTSKLSVSDAVITGNVITWKAATNSNLSILSPGAHGQVQFSLPIKSNLPATIKNNIITNSVIATSAEITTPVHTTDVQLQLATDFNFDLSGHAVGAAFPLQVGKKSTFAITFLVSNTTNDLDSTEVIASMPLPSSAWINVVIPDSEKSRLTYDAGSGKIRWNVGALPAFSGKTNPAPKVTFELSVTPQASDQGQAMRLLSNVTVSAHDTFTNQELTPNPVDQFTTTDLDDSDTDVNGGSVQ